MAYEQTLFIEREWQAGDDGSIPVINPVTEETVASISSASKARVDAALQSADLDGLRQLAFSSAAVARRERLPECRLCEIRAGPAACEPPSWIDPVLIVHRECGLDHERGYVDGLRAQGSHCLSFQLVRLE